MDTVRARLLAAGCGEGPLKDASEHHLGAHGKQLRVRLTLAAGDLLDVRASDAVAAATAVELVHNASLIHDDMIDGDTERRGQATVWARHGTTPALLLGDRFLAGAFAEAALTTRPARLVRLLSERVQTLVDGQAREDEPLTETASAEALQARYIATARAKSGTLFALPVECALLLAEAPPTLREPAVAAFEALGTAYQVLDDLADLEGTKSGRDRAADLHEGRLTAPVTQFLLHAPAREAAALRAFLSQSARDNEDVATWRRHLLASRAPAVTRRLHDLLIAEAREAGHRLPAPLRGLIDRTAQRVTGTETREATR
jgi:geranylgeranyl pyrophosphate synthase